MPRTPSPRRRTSRSAAAAAAPAALPPEPPPARKARASATRSAAPNAVAPNAVPPNAVAPNAVPPNAVAPDAAEQRVPRVRAPRQKRFLAMAGNIGAGKTTAAKLVSQALGYELFDEPVIDNRFLRDYYANMQRWSFTLQLEFLIRRVEHHELIHKVRKSCVQDRTLYEDPEIFAKYLHGLGHMTNAELELYYEYFERLSRDIARPDKVILFEVGGEDVLLERIRTRGREEERGIERQFLRGLNGYYTGFAPILRNKYGIDCLTVDVTQQDIRSGTGRERFLDEVMAFVAR